jgi:hypothetical protein
MYRAYALIPTLGVEDVLLKGINMLNWLLPCFQNEKNFSTAIRQQRDALRYVYERPYTQRTASDAQYRQIYPFLSWFNRSSGSSYVALSQRDPLSLLFFIHFFGVVLVLVVAWPATDAPFFASFRARGVLDLAGALEGRQGGICEGCNKIHDFMQVINFPLHALRLYQQYKRSSDSPRSIQPNWLGIRQETNMSDLSVNSSADGEQVSRNIRQACNTCY